MENVAETFERITAQREAFVEGACSGELPMKAKEAIEIARVKYPFPDVSVWNEAEGKFIPYTQK